MLVRFALLYFLNNTLVFSIEIFEKRLRTCFLWIANCKRYHVGILSSKNYFFCQKIPKWALQTSLLYDSYFLKWIWLFNNDIFLENNKILYFLKSPTWNMNRMIFYILSCTKLVALVSTILQMKNKTIFSIKPMDLSKTSFVYYKK